MQIYEAIKSLNYDTPEHKGLRLLQTLFLVFYVCSVVGWIYEEVFYYITENFIGDRGFLYGPWLPVYGCGAVLMLVLLKPFKRKPWLFFLLAMLVSGIVEYFTGWLMWEIWQKRWWDYTGLFLNINGFVCFRSVLSFALGGLGLMYFVDPLIRRLDGSIGYKKVWCLCGAIASILLIDFVFSMIYRDPI